MAKIMMKRSHALDTEEIRGRIGGLADKISNRLGGSWDWRGDEAICESNGAKARVGFDAETISIEISLPPAMRPFRRKLEAKIDEYLVEFLDAG
jgi:hypothetical protein